MHQQRKGWFEKNWWWAIPSGCLGCLTLLVGGCVLVLGGAFTALKSSTPYEEALDIARSHPAVIEALGEPIESGWQFQGSFSTVDDRSVADFSVPVSGPDGAGILRMKGERTGEAWDYEILEVELDDGSVIDLLDEDSRPPGSDPPVDV